MGIKAAISRPYAAIAVRNIRREAGRAAELQQALMKKLVSSAAQTVFGREHAFKDIRTYSDFRNNIPLCDYEQLSPYIERIKKGESNVLWPGRPVYLCKTSGTTSGVKYIPVSAPSLPHHIRAARNALLCYIHETGNTAFVNGKMIFLQGSPKLKDRGGIPTGRLSGIVAHHVPSYLQKNRLPSFRTNCIEDWESKVDAIVKETLSEKMTLISGIPPWVQMYFEKLLEASGRDSISELFPHFSLFVHGGVNFKPYEAVFQRLAGRQVDSIETYPASEGFIAYQDSQTEKGLLLNCNSGMFYEFIPAEQAMSEEPERIPLCDVEVGKNYAIVLNTNAGLWGYMLGDTVRFVGTKPYRLLVTGRTRHFISAFGEHVIAEEVESALEQALKKCPAEVVDFHVAPLISPREGLPRHEWFIEFARCTADLPALENEIDRQLCALNIYYRDLVKGGVLQTLRINRIRPGGFAAYMKSIGKLGGQNKTPRLANDRKMADALAAFLAS